MRNSLLISERARKTSIRPWTTLRRMFPSWADVSGGTRAGSTPVARRKASQSNNACPAPPAAPRDGMTAAGADPRSDACGDDAIGPCDGPAVGAGAGCNFDRSNDVRSQFSGIVLVALADDAGGTGVGAE